jgi:hypothetical protein
VITHAELRSHTLHLTIIYRRSYLNDQTRNSATIAHLAQELRIADPSKKTVDTAAHFSLLEASLLAKSSSLSARARFGSALLVRLAFRNQTHFDAFIDQLQPLCMTLATDVSTPHALEQRDDVDSPSFAFTACHHPIPVQVMQKFTELFKDETEVWPSLQALKPGDGNTCHACGC